MTRTRAETREHFGYDEPGMLEFGPIPTGTPEEIEAQNRAAVKAAKERGDARLDALKQGLIGQPPPR